MEENKNNFDEFKLDNGFIIDDSQTEIVPEAKRAKHSKNGLKTAVWIVSIIVVSVCIAFGAIYAGADYLGLGFGRGGNCTIEIEKGSGTAKIADKLKESGAVKMFILN